MISPSVLDIFYQPLFDFFQKNRLFQQPPPVPNIYREFDFPLVASTCPRLRLCDHQVRPRRSGRSNPRFTPVAGRHMGFAQE
jgi:hypothetical protein